MKLDGQRGLRIIIPVAALLVAVILIVGYQSFKATEQATFNEFNQRQLVLAGGAARGIELYFESLAGDLKALALRPEIQRLEEKVSRQEIQHTYAELASLGVNDIGILDANGILRYNVMARQIEGEDFSWRTYFSEARERNASDPFIIEFIEFKGVEAGEKGVLVAVPMSVIPPQSSNDAPADNFAGVVVLTLKLDNVAQQFVAPVSSSAGGRAFLIDQDYHVLWAPNQSWFGKNIVDESYEFIKFQEILGQMISETSGTGEFSYYEFDEAAGKYLTGTNEEYLIAFQAVNLGEETWSIGVWAPKNDARQLIQAVYFRQLLVVVLSILITLSGTTYTLIRLNKSYTLIAEEQSKVLTAIEASHDAIWVSDNNRRVVMVNSAMETLTGKSRDELLGQTCRNLLHLTTPDGTSLCDVNCPVLPLADSNGRVDTCLNIKSEEEVWLEINYGRVIDADGHLIGVVHIAHDQTHRKEVEHLKDEFISMVSHELRTPLNHIKGFATTLLQTDVDWAPATQHDFLGSINQEADRLTDLVSKILHLARLEPVGLPMEKEWYQVADLIEGALHRRRSQTGVRNVNLDISPNIPALFVDGREIEIVLVNLIENAIKYSNSGTPIALNVEHQGNQVVFSVVDQGPGIPPEHRELIFERFYRVDGKGGRGSGIGLGLAICKRIVEAHNGRIWVESTPGDGSCFTFSLPLDGSL